LLESLVKQFPDNAEYRKGLSETLRDYSPVQVKVGRLQEATDTLRRAVAIAEQLAAENPNQPSQQRNLATNLLDLAGVEYSRGLVADSGTTAARSVEIFRKLVSLPPSDSHPYNPVLLAAALNRVAVADRKAEKLVEAAAAHQEAIKVLQNLADKRPERVNRAD